jgi:ABC-type uncharacterized transport system
VALMSRPSWYVSTLYFLGMLLVFIGERIIGPGSARVLSAVGVVAIAAAIAIRAARTRQADVERRAVERMLLALYTVGLVAVAIYIAQSDLSSKVLGHPLERDWPKLATVLAALWPAVWLFAALPILMSEFSYANVARAPKLELARIRDALWSGVGVAGALVFAFALTYVASERDKKVDLSYFRTAKPGESTRKLIGTMDQPVQVSLFFPPSNEVREQVLGYFEDLRKESKLLEVQSFDRDVDVTKAKELGVAANGTVVIARGGHKEPMSVGLELEAARSQLRNLDKDVQTRLLKVARPPRTVYFVTGHGERSFEPGGDTDKRPTLRTLKEAMAAQGYNVKTLGAAEGLAQDVPADATALAIIGPTKPFLAEESAALQRYFDRGGRLLIALEPDGVDDKELLAHLGLKYVPTAMANDQVYARRSQQLSDRGNIVTASFSSHPSVTTLGRLGGRAPLVLFGTGHFEELKEKPAGISSDTTVKSHTATWVDLDGNFNFDPPAEQRKAWPLALAVVKKGSPNDKDKKDEGRAIVVADSDLLSDGTIEVAGNPAFLVDGMKWLVGEEAITGEVSNENDVPVVHTKKQDQVWFYGSSFFMPALVLALGYFVTRRRGGKQLNKEKQS